MLGPVNEHMNRYNLMEAQQRGAKVGCSGTIDDLLINRMVTLDCHRRKRNLIVAWIDVRKAYDSIDHGWLKKIMHVHKLPIWICQVISKLCDSWNTSIIITTSKGSETSLPMYFNRGLLQGDALCPCLFTLCLNPVAWRLSSTEGYRLSKPIASRITNLLYVDDLKVLTTPKAKLKRVLEMA